MVLRFEDFCALFNEIRCFKDHQLEHRVNFWLRQFPELCRHLVRDSRGVDDAAEPVVLEGREELVDVRAPPHVALPDLHFARRLGRQNLGAQLLQFFLPPRDQNEFVARRRLFSKKQSKRSPDARRRARYHYRGGFNQF